MSQSHLMANYAPLPIAFERGEGVWLYDTSGEAYLDALGGIAVCALGHAHPVVAAAIADQAQTLIHTSNIYQVSHQRLLADKLIALSGMDNAFFSNSGAEANEAAIKLTRLYARRKQIDKPKVIVMEGSFHGRTLATLSATGNNKVQVGFEPLVDGFIRVPFGDVESLKSLSLDADVVAVMFEPIQGEGGINIPPDGFLKQVRSLCDTNQWLMILDEIQTGMGRTGQWFAGQHEDIVPDIMTLAKALGNGVPIGACLARGQAAELFAPGSHGSTYGGNPLVCRTALTVIDVIEQDQLVTQAHDQGLYLKQQFEASLAGVASVVSIRGRGMMIGIELDRPCAELVGKALERKLLINVTAGQTIRLLPPLITSQKECDQIVSIVTDLIKAF
jgi:acetylornithine aminotransferase